MIGASEQSGLPINEYFSVVGTATFKADDGRELSLTVVYQLRFVSKIKISLSASLNAIARG